MLCSVCQKVWYCGVDCQKAAWKTHKVICANACLVPNDGEVVCKYKEPTGQVRGMTQKEFKEKMKATFVLAPLFSKAMFDKANTNGPATNRLAVSDSIALEYQGDALLYGLVALKDIESGDNLCSLGGIAMLADDWDKEKQSLRARCYSAHVSSSNGINFVFDTSKYMSLGTIVNDGLPNVTLEARNVQTTYSDKVKIPLDKVLVAIRRIKAGEYLYTDYGIKNKVKIGPYHMDKVTLDRMVDQYADHFFFKQDGKTTIDLNQLSPLEVHEITYILSTPYALVHLYLHTDLDPLKTVNAYDKFPADLKGLLDKSNHIKPLLTGLAKIRKQDRQAFLKIVKNISQLSLAMLFSHLHLIETLFVPTMKDYENFGRVLDDLHIKFFGAADGSCWDTTEEDQFKRKFLTKEHVKAIYNDSVMGELPATFVFLCKQMREGFLQQVYAKFNLEEQTQLSSLLKMYKL